MKLMLFLAVALACLYGTKALGKLKVAAFNIQVLGQSKMGKQWVVDHIVNILNRYDLVCIQEIRDADEKTPYDLLDQTNAAAGSDPFAMFLSTRQGRTSSKEQVAFFYWSCNMILTGSYQDPDPSDRFERPPTAVKFNSPGYQVGTWGFLCTHVKPTDAVAEIDYLVDVYDDARISLLTSNILIGGDLNAGCSYVPAYQWANIRLRTETRFKWVIDDTADTTLGASQCPYDRLILAGTTVWNQYVDRSAGVFNYWQFYGMTETVAKEVSDHYPVFLEFY